MRGAPVRTIQELAGHASITTTMRYMHLTASAADEAIRLLDAAPGVAAMDIPQASVSER
jgi:integrase